MIEGQGHCDSATLHGLRLRPRCSTGETIVYACLSINGPSRRPNSAGVSAIGLSHFLQLSTLKILSFREFDLKQCSVCGQRRPYGKLTRRPSGKCTK